jgi:hypothetical protein
MACDGGDEEEVSMARGIGEEGGRCGCGSATGRREGRQSNKLEGVTKEGDRGIYIISTPTLFLAFEPFKCLY